MTSLATNHCGRIVLLLMLCFTISKTQAQLSANFSATTTSGCAPIVVQFKDESKGNPQQWRWELGNGVTTSLQNPSTTYFNPGTYTIKLVVRNASGADSLIKEKLITVFPNPAAQFKVSDSTGCFPLPVKFTDLSTTASGSITRWTWDFGDGTVSNEMNPLHTYTAEGKFNVTLQVQNSFGCIKTLSKEQHIQVSKGVKAAFEHKSSGQCKAPATIQFTNKSSGPGSLNYVWDFGDGTQSTEEHPSHTYNSNGSFTVTMIAVSPQGCRDTLKKINLISLGETVSGFNTTTFCEKQPQTITNTTNPTPGSVFWNFGDGTTSTEINPVKQYNNPGNYTIKLINNFGGCTDSVIKNVVVHAKPKAEFSTSSTISCKIPFTVNFTNTTTGNATYQWNFGDGAVSTEKNPSHTYTTAGTYTVSLVVTNLNGCTDTLLKKDHIQIKRPEISLLNLPKSGCNPLTINPGSVVNTYEPVVSYQWNFGDGHTSNAAAPVHTYTKAGNYSVSLTITTTTGCTETITVKDAVKVGDKPKANFEALPADVCASDPVRFTDKSTGNVDQWLWNFGDRDSSTLQNPEHVYQKLGKATVTLIVWSNTCADTIRMEDIVNVRPPLSIFSFTNSCTNKFQKVFTDSSVGALSWHWEFGDGTTSTTQHPIHTYALPGTYKVKLTVYNEGCKNENFTNIKVIDEKADFTADKTTLCKDEKVNLTARNVNGTNISAWHWNFGDGHVATSPNSASHLYSAPGTYKITLTVLDVLGCTSSIAKNVTVYGPTADFTPGASAVCIDKSTITFTDQSKSDGTNAIVKWNWSFGDGTEDSTSKAPFVYTYSKAGEYTVGLKVTDSYGCSSFISKATAVIIAQPKALFYSPDTLSCTSKPVRFVNQSSGYDLNYQWSFGDGLAATEKEPVHHYAAVGTYTINLSVTDRYGCKDVLSLPSYINISYPKAGFTVSDSVGTCPPLLVKFTNTSTNYVSLRWDFGDGSNSVHENPSHHYTLPGTYYAKLVITGQGGCTDSFSKKIVVKGPTGEFRFTPSIGCMPREVKFTATTTNRVSFIWDFSDGTTIASQDSVISHIYTVAGEYIPKMIVKDAFGCSVPIIAADTVRVFGVEAAFSTDKVKLCDSGYVNFTNKTVSNDLITKYAWSFADGTTSSEANPLHFYNKSGTYTARLIAYTKTGCSDTAFHTSNVSVFNGPDVQIISDSSFCVPATVHYNGNVTRGDADIVDWKWNFGNGQTATTQHPVQQLYNTDGIYKVTYTITDGNGCKDSAIKDVRIHPLPQTDAGKDALLCRDQSTRFEATGAATYSWKPSPDLSCTNCSSPTVTPTQTTVYHLTGYTSFGCSKDDSVKITVRQRFTVNASRGDTICEGFTSNLWATGADKYTWFPSTGLDNPTASKTKAKPAATTLYRVVGRDNDNCFTDTATVLIKVNPTPKVNAGADFTLAVGSNTQIKTESSPDVTSWRWTPGSGLSCTNCPDPMAAPKQSTTYSVEVKTDGGCVQKDDVTITVICNNGNLFIPNTFSPNGDGMNDRFYPRGTGIGLIRSLRVFNRWGEVVFEKINFNANDPAAGWDGIYKGQKLSPDVFIYSCEVICENGVVLPVKGDLTLLQ